MSLTANLLRGIADALQAEAFLFEHPLPGGDVEKRHESWAHYQDAADAVNDLADHVAETERG